MRITLEEISTEELKEAFLFAVANGWRPRPVAEESFDAREAPTEPNGFATVVP